MLELLSGLRHHGKRMIASTEQLLYTITAHLQRTRQQLANHLCTTWCNSLFTQVHRNKTKIHKHAE